MGKIISAFFSIIVVLFLSGSAIAQVKPVVKITSLKQKDELIRLSLSSSKPFIFGSNTYVLYVGNRNFTRNEQWHKNGKGYMAFLLSADEYTSLQDGADIYLTYGEVNLEEEDINELAKNSRKCWSLGKLNKSELKK